MYTSECIAYKTAELKFETVNGLPALQIATGDNLTNFTLSVGQLEALLDGGEWWLWKNRPE